MKQVFDKENEIIQQCGSNNILNLLLQIIETKSSILKSYSTSHTRGRISVNKTCYLSSLSCHNETYYHNLS